MRTRVRLGGLAAGLVVAVLVVAPVAAASPWFSVKQTGTFAFAFGETCQDNGDGTTTCQGQSLDVLEGSQKSSGSRRTAGQQVCTSTYTVTFVTETGEPLNQVEAFGCVSDPGTLTVDGLDSITLAATEIDLFQFSCDEETGECTETPAGSITVSGTWMGVGPLVTSTGRFSFDDGVCRIVQSDRTTQRSAEFSGSFEAFDVGMSQGTFSFRTSCIVV